MPNTMVRLAIWAQVAMRSELTYLTVNLSMLTQLRRLTVVHGSWMGQIDTVAALNELAWMRSHSELLQLGKLLGLAHVHLMRRYTMCHGMLTCVHTGLSPVMLAVLLLRMVLL